jgi:hypothetical protein
MRTFSKISPKLWRSPRFRSLESGDARLFYLFCLTCEHQSSAGCFRLPDAYAASDLGWPEDRLSDARSALVKAELLVHDASTDEYFVPRWFKHNPAKNPEHKQGVERLISELESDLVREVAEAEYQNSQGSPLAPEPNPIDTPKGNGSHLANTPYMAGRRV